MPVKSMIKTPETPMTSSSTSLSSSSSLSASVGVVSGVTARPMQSQRDDQKIDHLTSPESHVKANRNSDRLQSADLTCNHRMFE